MFSADSSIRVRTASNRVVTRPETAATTRLCKRATISSWRSRGGRRNSRSPFTFSSYGSLIQSPELWAASESSRIAEPPRAIAVVYSVVGRRGCRIKQGFGEPEVSELARHHARREWSAQIIQQRAAQNLAGALQRRLVGGLGLIKAHQRLGEISVHFAGNERFEGVGPLAGDRIGGFEPRLDRAVCAEVIEEIVLVSAEVRAVRAFDGRDIARKKIVLEGDEVVEKVRAGAVVGDQAART